MPNAPSWAKLFQDRFWQFPFTVNSFGIQGKQGGLESVKKIKGGGTRLRDAGGGKEVPSDVGFK